jgi:protein-disulfide isomerase
LNDFLHDSQTPVVNAKGTTTLVEFFDYQCSICHMMYSVINSIAAMDPHLRIVYKDFPIFGPASTYAAKGSFAAYQQGPKLYKAYHDAMFNIGAMEGSMTIPEVDMAAQGAGLNMKAFHAAVNSKVVANELKQSIALGKSIKMIGTPALIVAPSNASAKTSMQQLSYFPGYAQKPQLLTAIAHAQ